MDFHERRTTYFAARRRKAIQKWIARLVLLTLTLVGCRVAAKASWQKTALESWATVSRTVAWWWNAPEKIAGRQDHRAQPERRIRRNHGKINSVLDRLEAPNQSYR